MKEFTFLVVVLFNLFLEEVPAGNQTGRKISQQGSCTPKDDMNVKPSYINVSYNAGYLSDDEEVPVEGEVV